MIPKRRGFRTAGARTTVDKKVERAGARRGAGREATGDPSRGVANGAVTGDWQ
jgi:hypothetical protein